MENKEEVPMQNKELIEVKHKLQRIHSAQQYIEELEQQMEENEDKITVAEAILRKEKRDVEKLKRVSLASVLSWIKKDQEERLYKEEDEAYRAALLVKQLQEEGISLQREYDQCLSLIAQEEEVKKQLTQLQIQFAPSNEKTELKQLYQELEGAQLLEKELIEAIGAGYDAIHRLDAIEDSLSSAQGWGVYDLMGGGVVSSIVKHSHIEQAQEQIGDAQYDLRRFQKEVKDVQKMEDIELDISAGLSFMDIMFDNLFSDFMVQQKVNTSLDHVRTVISGVNVILDDLLQKQKECAEKIEAVEQELNQKLMKI